MCRIGTSQADAGNKAMYGWWSHVSFDDADGRLIRDYIPVKRVTDNVVGFYDRVQKSFTSSANSSAEFVAGTETGETISGYEVASATFSPARLIIPSVTKGLLTITVTVTTIPGTMIIVR